jgi:Domain of unknown function (DUF4136)
MLRGTNALALSLLLVAAACHPTGVETVSDLDTVTTAHDSSFSFANALTYSLPSQVVSIGVPDGGTPQPIDPSTEQAILRTLENEMETRGYQKVPAAQGPDLVMTAAALQVTNITYYYSYWYSYWGFYYPGYPGYPYYPPVVGVSAYTVGTLAIDLATADTAGSKLNGVWAAAVRGLGTGSVTDVNIRVTNGIAQAFTQSPYLGHR